MKMRAMTMCRFEQRWVDVPEKIAAQQTRRELKHAGRKIGSMNERTVAGKSLDIAMP